MTKRSILVDTQSLILLVVGLTKPNLIARHKRTRDAYTQTDLDILLEPLGFSPEFLFCPHVAAEASNLIGQYGEPDRSSVMATPKALSTTRRKRGSPQILSMCRTCA